MKKVVTQKHEKTNWHAHSIDYAFNKTQSSKEGLAKAEAEKRYKENGANILPQKKPKSVVLMFLEELINPIILILLVAMAFSFVVGELLDGFVILAIILIDALLATIQSKRAERIASSLSAMIKVKTKVLRDNEKVLVDASRLVAGDVVFLESGDKVSADMRIVECSNFTVDEALLTGESINAVKTEVRVGANAPLGDRTNMVFSGSSVITGRATCVVVETGVNTEIGGIATNLNDVEDQKSPLTIRINKFSKQISAAIVVVAVVIFLIMLFQHNPLKDIFLCVIALAVSAMPEGLPLAVTMALTVASNRMGKNNVVVKHLNAVESLGSCTVIATDKTGTLTLNEQTAKVVVLPSGNEFEVTGSGYNDNGKVKVSGESEKLAIKELATMGVLNNEAEFKKENDKFVSFGDSIDIAFKVLGTKAAVNTRRYKILHQIPYESENKYSAVFFEHDGKTYVTAKGSMEKLFEYSSTMKVADSCVSLDVSVIQQQNESLAKRGYRVIALAVGEVEKKESYTDADIKNLSMIGLVGFIDPVRPESKPAIQDCKKAGIKVIMITGDHPLTAYSIAKDIEIAEDISCVATGVEVAAAFKQGEAVFDEFVKGKTVFSRVTPTDKLNIVNSLKRQGEFVAVTGDGVNDSPAIKTAHIGIAMGSGTDVSKETADMIIMDDNFKSIVEGVKEGRNAYANIRKITYFLLTCSLAEVLFFMLGLICGTETPLLAIQLLWINVVTDGFQDLSLSLERPELGIMTEKPRPTTESLFSRSMLSQSAIMGSIIGGMVFGAWIIFINVLKYETIVARSLIMALMVFLQNMHAFNCRSEKQSVFKIPFKTNWFFVVAVLGSIGLQILFMEVEALSMFLDLTTVSYLALSVLLVVSLTIILASELYKKINREKQRL